MNYSTLTIDELKHYAALDARTPLEIALSNALQNIKIPADEINKAWADIESAEYALGDAKNRLESLLD